MDILKETATDCFYELIKINKRLVKKGTIVDNLILVSNLYLGYLKSFINKKNRFQLNNKTEINYNNYLFYSLLKYDSLELKKFFYPDTYSYIYSNNEFLKILNKGTNTLLTINDIKKDPNFIYIFETGKEIILFVKPEINNNSLYSNKLNYKDILLEFFRCSTTSELISKTYNIHEQDILNSDLKTEKFEFILNYIQQLRSNSKYCIYKTLNIIDDYYNPIMNKVLTDDGFNKDVTFNIVSFIDSILKN